MRTTSPPSLTDIAIQLRVADSVAAYRSIEAGTDVLPALRSPQLARYLRALGLSEPELAGRAVPRAHFRGGAVGCRRGDPFQPFARALAAATGRPCVEIGLDLPAGPTPGGLTLVTHPRALTPEALAALVERPDVSLLTGRDEAAVAALVVRTVTDAARERRAAWVDLDAVDRSRELLFPDGASPAARRSLDLLSLRGSSRGCCVSFADGVVCGRDPDLDEHEPIGGLGPGQQRSACCQGEGCFRPDAVRARRVPVREVDARVVLVDGCQNLQVGGGQSPSEITMALAALDGLAVAYVGCPWLRDSARFAAPLLRALLRSGLSLGEAVRELNACAEADEASLGGFVLLGDGALVPHPDGAGPVEHEPRAGAGEVRWDGERHLARLRTHGRAAGVTGPAPLLAVPRGDGELLVVPDGDGPLAGPLRVETADVDAGAMVAGRLLPAIRRLREAPLFGIDGIGARLGGLERQVRDLGEEWFQPIAGRDLGLCLDLLERCRRRLGDLEESVVRQETERLAAGFTDFADRWQGQYAYGDWTAGRCPVCGGGGFRRQRMTHLLDAGVELARSLCPVCGDLGLARREPACDVEVSGPDHAVRGRPFTYEVTLRNSSRLPLTVSLGACVTGEELFGVEMRQVHRLELGPGEAATVHASGAFPSPAASADRWFARFVVCAAGELTYVRRNLWLRSAG